MISRALRVAAACGASTLFLAGAGVGAQSIQLGELVAASSITNALYVIDRTTGAETFLTGTLDLSGTGLASLGTKLMATDMLGTSLATFATGEVDPGTGVVTAISDQGGDINWHALAADQFSGVYYTSALDSAGVLVRMTPAGTLTQIGPGMPFMRGLAFDHASGLLYGASGTTPATSTLHTIDPATGVATLIGATIDSCGIGLAYDDASATLYAINDSGLYTLDVTTGAGTLVGPHGVAALDGLAIYAPIPPPPPTLFASPATISLAAGGTQTLTLAPGPAWAGSIYLILGSVSGTSPGQAVGRLLVPLNYDPYFLLTLTSPNRFVSGSLGLLDGAGQASATLSLPAGSDPALAGISGHHVALLFGSTSASNPVSLDLVP